MWQLADKKLSSRLLLGTAQYPSLSILTESIIASGAEVITVALKRQLGNGQSPNAFWSALQKLPCHILPNTAGCRSAQEAIMTAEMAREIFQTSWVKLEVIGDEYNLQPDPIELIQAAKTLINKGFTVLPYCTDDLVICQKLCDVGCHILMPWAAPIGSAKGIINPYALSTLRSRLADMTLIVDAGIGKPSHAVMAMELGMDAVLLNTAVALAHDPVNMASAFKHGIIAGREAYNAGIIPERELAQPSTPLIDTPFWLQAEHNP